MLRGRMASLAGCARRGYQPGGVVRRKAGVVDLRSDTLTAPDAEMRSAMAGAEVGDDVLKEDPTVVELERRGAELLGMEAALFVPSGSMGNLLAILSHCTERGSELIVGAGQHIHRWEQGSAAQFAGVSAWVLPNLADGSLDLSEVEAAIRDHSDFHQPRTALICIENTHNSAGGRILPPAFLDGVRRLAERRSIPVHVDGARLYNAAVASGVSPASLVKGFSSVSMCLSKGLGAPVGSILAGRKDFIQRANRHRKALGGGIRQGGILAAAGLLALDRAPVTIARDHRMAAVLADGVDGLGDARVKVQRPVETNIVMLRTNNLDAQVLANALQDESNESTAVLCFPYSTNQIRWVVYNAIEEEQVSLAIAKFQSVLNSC